MCSTSWTTPPATAGDVTLAGAPYAETREMLPRLAVDIQESARRIERIVGDLKHFARPGARVSEDFDVNDVVRRALRLLTLLIQKRTDALHVVLADWLPVVRGNAQHVEQVAVNLVVNALEALPSRDRAVTVTTAHDASAGRIVLEVRDEGIGMTDAHLARLGEAFFTTKEAMGGTGLGIAIASSLVRLYDGQLTFVSQPGKGTCARVTLPEARTPTRPRKRASHETSQRAPDSGGRRRAAVAAQRKCGASRLGISQVITLDDARNVAPLLSEHAVGAMLLDLSMPELSGRALLDQVTADYPDVPVIVLTATNDLETAVACMQAGAKDYLVKPVEASRLTSALKRVIEVRALEAELLSLKARVLEETPHEHSAFADIVTHDRSMFAIFRYLEAIAPSPQPVLITGETGTGKELVARAVHRLSGRPGDLVTVNTAGLDDTLFTDTLFGHTRGAFTGADRPREGLVSIASDGTLFLDEIGDLAMASQVKLLRLLQDGGYYPLGADRPRQCRARIIVATNRDVARAVADGTFRNDLYYRLRIHHFALPPLRARLDDLPLLVDHFVERAATTLGKPAPAVPAALYTLLKIHPFPGNVRELEAMVFDAVARQKGSVLGLQSFKDAIGATSPPVETQGAAIGGPDGRPVARSAANPWRGRGYAGRRGAATRRRQSGDCCADARALQTGAQQAAGAAEDDGRNGLSLRRRSPQPEAAGQPA